MKTASVISFHDLLKNNIFSPKPVMAASKYHLHISGKTRLLNMFRRLLILTSADRLLAAALRGNKLPSVFYKIVPPNYLYRSNSVREFTLAGIDYVLDVSDTVGHSNYFAIHDAGHDNLYKQVSTGMVIYDIGANVGSTSLNLANLTGDTGKVFSFEPDRHNFATASHNIDVNKADNVRIFNVGLGDKEQVAYQYNVNEKNRGMMRILPEDKAAEGLQSSAVEILRLDDLVEMEQLPAPQLIKIDVEGFEYKALKGAEDLLVNHKPKLFIELDDENLREQQSSASELVGYLEGIGYKISDAASGIELHKNSNFSNCHIDILAV